MQDFTDLILVGSFLGILSFLVLAWVLVAGLLFPVPIPCRGKCSSCGFTYSSTCPRCRLEERINLWQLDRERD